MGRDPEPQEHREKDPVDMQLPERDPEPQPDYDEHDPLREGEHA